MKLYHYSANSHDVLKSLYAQAKLTDKEAERANAWAVESQAVGPYHKHIALFFEKVPLDELGDIYGDYHEIWYHGNEIYEHTVSTEDMADRPYVITETETHRATIGELWDDDYAHRGKYYTTLNKRQQDNNERGHTMSAMVKAAKPFVGGTRAAFEANRGKEDLLYAANVPHLMYYAGAFEIPVRKIEKVTVK